MTLCFSLKAHHRTLLRKLNFKLSLFLPSRLPEWNTATDCKSVLAIFISGYIFYFILISKFFITELTLNDQ
jgi:hypothetical protein